MLSYIAKNSATLNAGIYLMQEVFNPDEVVLGTVVPKTLENAGIIQKLDNAVGAKGLSLCFSFDPTTMTGNAQAASA